MNIRNLKTLLKTMIEHKVPVTPMIWGQHGVGKSNSIEQVAKEMGYGFVKCILSQKEAVDLSGVLYTFESKELGMSVTSAHPPDWFAQAIKHGKLVLFLDEFNMGRREVLNAAFQLVLDRELNGMKLPPDVFIICAGNPEDERYDVTPLSESLKDRFMHIQVTMDVPVWLDWAQNKVSQDVFNYIKSNTAGLYFEDKKDDKFPVEIKHSARSWERVSMIHNLAELPTEIKLECYKGIVGMDQALAFFSSLSQTEKPLTAEEILENTPKAVKKIQEWSEGKSARIDLINSSIENLIKVCEKEDLTKTKKNQNSLSEFLLELPSDVFVAAVSKIVELKNYGIFFKEKKELMDRINQVVKSVKA